MKRIAGIFNLNQETVTSPTIDRMLTVMKCHHENENHTWINGSIGLGCAQIGSGSYSPSVKSLYSMFDGRWTIAFDGRIDNRRELLTTLRVGSSSNISSISDEELVLATYQKWGVECPVYLIGDFVFAIWDETNHRLFCARDHFGVKPFHYSFTGETFVFASNPDAIVSAGKIHPIINESRIADHLVNPLDAADKTSTFFEDVFRLPPACRLVVQPSGMKMARYWEIQPSRNINLKNVNNYIEAFDQLLEDAVDCRLKDNNMSASMLSGGLDSSSIVGMGRKILAKEGLQPLQVFAVTSNTLVGNRETAYISSVLGQGGLRACLISEKDIIEWLDEIVQNIQEEAEPFDCLMNLHRSIHLQAREMKVNALIDGGDGDTLLAGSGHLLPLWRHREFGTILDETLRAKGIVAEYKVGRQIFVDSFLSAITPVAPEWYRNIRRPFRDYRAVSKAIRESIIDREFAVRCKLQERFTTLYSHSPRISSPTQIEYHKIAMEHPFLTAGLERYERVAGGFGIEARHPFTDIRLAEFCLGLPWRLKTQHGWTKYILRCSMEPYLPANVVWRTDKDSLMWEVNRIILQNKAKHFHQITLDEKESLKPYVDIQKLEKIWRQYLKNNDETHADLIWSGIALAFWLRRHRNMVRDLKLEE
jgi:asparagine synthase (glutamine-hydrolysing)